MCTKKPQLQRLQVITFAWLTKMALHYVQNSDIRIKVVGEPLNKKGKSMWMQCNTFPLSVFQLLEMSFVDCKRGTIDTSQVWIILHIAWMYMSIFRMLMLQKLMLHCSPSFFLAGLEVLISIRPGNTPLPENHGFQTITTFAEILTWMMGLQPAIYVQKRVISRREQPTYRIFIFMHTANRYN